MTRDAAYFARIGHLGAHARWGSPPEEEPLAAFDPGPPAGTHDPWIDAWRLERARREASRAAARLA